MSDLAKALGVGSLTGGQVDAITNAYLDVCATDKFVNGEYPLDRHDCDEISEAVPQTKIELEKAFPFLMEAVEDE